MPTGTIVSLDEYLSPTYDPDCEYVDGELIERNTAESIAADRYRLPDITVTTRKIRGRILREPPFFASRFSPLKTAPVVWNQKSTTIWRSAFVMSG
jgi:hypothetical protein